MTAVAPALEPTAEDKAGERRHLVTARPEAYVKTCRFQLSLLAFTSTLCLYILRASMSVAIVCMTYDPAFNRTLYLSSMEQNGSSQIADNIYQTTAASSGGNNSNLGLYVANVDTDTCPPVVDDFQIANFNHEDVYPWSRFTRGWVLAAYYVGYVVTQIPAGWVSTRFGTKWPLFASMFTQSILALLTPVVARISVYLLMAIQAVKGMAAGMHYPLFYHMIGIWSPPYERSFMIAMLFSGAPVGTVVSSVLSGYLCNNGFDGGWPSIFYIFGIMGVLLSLLWVFLAYDRPDDHPRISAEEQDLLNGFSSSNGLKEKRSVPWKSLLTTGPLYAVFMTNICYSWGWYVVLTTLPQYLKDVLRFSIKQNGLINAIPYVANWVVSLVGSFIADAIAKREMISITALRKIFETLGLLPSAAFAVGVAFLSSCHERILPVVLLSAWVGFLGFTRSGADCTQMELAPAFAGVMMGIDQTLTAVMGVIAPPVVAALTKEGTHAEWQVVFFITAAITLFGCIIFILFSSSEEQEWAKGDPHPHTAHPTWALDVTSGQAVTKQGRRAFSLDSWFRFVVGFCLWDMPYR